MADDSQGGLRGDPVLRNRQGDGTRDQMCKRINELEAALDHLRARLRELAEFWQHNAGDWRKAHDQEEADVLEQCVADLLAVLTERPQEEKTDENVNKEKHLARVVTMGEGKDSRTASEDVAGRVEPSTPDQARHEP